MFEAASIPLTQSQSEKQGLRIKAGCIELLKLTPGFRRILLSRCPLASSLAQIYVDTLVFDAGLCPDDIAILVDVPSVIIDDLLGRDYVDVCDETLARLEFLYVDFILSQNGVKYA